MNVRCWGLTLGTLVGVLARVAWMLAGPPPADTPKLQIAQPVWQIGDRWEVETSHSATQRREKVAAADVTPAVKWRFTVEGTEALAGRECFRVRVAAVDAPAGSPVTCFWVDRSSYLFCQVQMQVGSPTGLRTITQSYSFETGNAPVTVPLFAAVPLDWPSFADPHSKGPTSFQFSTQSGPLGAKAVGELGFDCSIEQSIRTADPECVRNLADNFAKNVSAEQLVQVQLKTAAGQVNQLWQVNLPWPAFADNGQTQSRLVKYEAAGN